MPLILQVPTSTIYRGVVYILRSNRIFGLATPGLISISTTPSRIPNTPAKFIGVIPIRPHTGLSRGRNGQL